MFSGSGPGIQAPDGCSVQLYARLPYMDDLEPVRAFFEPGTSVLELGCGTGRLTRKLLEWGLSVTSVDECAAMLAEVPAAANAVLSSIEALKLDKRFDCVLLASCLINHPLELTRHDFISCAARHLKPHGVLLIERHDPQRLRDAKVGPVSQMGQVSIYVETVARRAACVDMKVRYESDGGAWTHLFTVEALTEMQIEDILRKHGIGPVSWHGSSRRWAAGSMFLNAA